MDEVINALLKRASEACYWKEKFEDEKMQESAEKWQMIEAIWLEAIAIVKGETT